MATAPRFDLAEAEALAMSIDLTRTVGAAVGVPAIVLDAEAGDDPARWHAVAGALDGVAVVTVSATDGPADVTGEVDELVAAVHAHPQAATVAALLLRHLPDDPIEAFHAESLAYATLQAGAEHQAWMAEQGRRTRNDDDARVRLDPGPPLTITLTRPRLHNLLDARGRGELADAFHTAALAAADTVEWRAEGPSFCAGGDPAEFGTVADATTAHLLRMAASPAPSLAAIRERVTAHVHGACVGAGIELAAQAARIVAAPDTRFRLPELTMGLIPGVGGTWSISRRIGTARLLRWLLLDLDVDAETALEWGLIEAIGPAR